MRPTLKKAILLLTLTGILMACNQQVRTAEDETRFKFVVLDPGHFHAALVQKNMYPQVDSLVHVYAPAGDELLSYRGLIEQYNSREDNPTHWKESLYTGDDFLDRMIQERKGNLVILAGNNRNKTDYISQSVAAGLHVLSDKPMAINAEDFAKLEDAFTEAAAGDVLIYDIMTERHEITNILQKEFSQINELFGDLQKGSSEDPAIVKESVHHFYKEVSGKPIVRPAWYFDVEQQGAGIVDVTTHLVDLVQWQAFPDQILDYRQDIELIDAKQWPTGITPAHFEQVTQQAAFPSYLQKDVNEKGELDIYANGEINYEIKGTHVRIRVIWNFEAPEGTADTHLSLLRGSRALLTIRQGEEQDYKPILYLSAVHGNEKEFDGQVVKAVEAIARRYPGVEAVKEKDGSYRIMVPAELASGHEAHFEQVTKKYLSYLEDGQLPGWEVPNMLAKYYTTTRALQLSTQ